MVRTFDSQHTSRLMILGGGAVLITALLYVLWLRHTGWYLPLAEEFGLQFRGPVLFGLTAVVLFDPFVFIYETIRAQRISTAKR